jgi:threonine dehydratase
MLLLLERAKQVVEGAGAASVAAILSDDLDVEGETVMPLLCGGNLDMTMMRTLVVHALTDRRQILQLQVHIDDEPGTMAELSGIIGAHDANIHDVRHDRSVGHLSVGEAYLVFEVETAGAKQAASIIDDIERAGYPVEDISNPE